MKCTICTNEKMEYQLASIDSLWGEKIIKLSNVKCYACECGHVIFEPDEARAMQTITQVIAEHAPDIEEVIFERPEVSDQCNFKTVRDALEVKQDSDDPIRCPEDTKILMVDVTEEGDLYLKCPKPGCPQTITIQSAYQAKLPKDSL